MQFITLEKVCDLTGYKQSSIYQRIADGTFPKPHKIGRNNRWLLSDVQDWIQNIVHKNKNGGDA